MALESEIIILVLLHQSVIWAHGLARIWIWMYILPKHAAVHFIIFIISDILGSTYPEVAPKHLKIKICGDGARMSHSSSLFVCSFSLLEESKHVLSTAGRVYCKLSISAISTKSQPNIGNQTFTVPNNKYNTLQWQEHC